MHQIDWCNEFIGLYRDTQLNHVVHVNSADELNDSLLDLADELLQLDTLNMNASIHTPASEDMLATDV